LGLTDVSFPHPMYHGDTLYTETLISQKRLSASRPGQGIVTMQHTGRNQDGTVVALATRSCLMWTREAHRGSQAQPHEAQQQPHQAQQGSGQGTEKGTMSV
jgi:hypothetical protein